MKLQKLRRKKRLTQKQLAELSGISIRTIEKYEQGELDINKASMETIYNFSKILECKMEDLYEDTTA